MSLAYGDYSGGPNYHWSSKGERKDGVRKKDKTVETASRWGKLVFLKGRKDALSRGGCLLSEGRKPISLWHLQKKQIW